MVVREAITSPTAPPAIGPYSPAIRAGNLLFISGQIPLDPATGQLVRGDIRVQTTRVMDNLRDLLVAAGADTSHVVRTTIFLADLSDFAVVNEIYATYFTPPYRASRPFAARRPRRNRRHRALVAVLIASSRTAPHPARHQPLGST
jgi:2-iminobutanoate/2-iminopropanoate deaminase